MTIPRSLQCVLVMLLLALSPAAGLLALAVGPDDHTTTVDAEDAHPTSGTDSRALLTVTDTTMDQFTNGTHDTTMAVNISGGALRMRTLYSLGSPISGDNSIFSLTEGLDGSIYGGGRTTGRMVKVDPATNRISDVNGGNAMVTNEVFISVLATGTDGTIWGGTGNGYVFRMDPTTEQITVLNGSNPIDPANAFISGLTVLSNGTIWGMTYTSIVFEIDPTSNTVTTFGDLGGAVPGEARAIVTDHDNNVWIGCTDTTNSWMTLVNTTQHISTWDGVAVVGNPTTKSLAVTPDGMIWGGTDGGTTLFSVDPSGPTIKRYWNPTASEAETTTLTVGTDGMLWGGTRYAAHIFQTDPRSGLSADHGRALPNNHIAIRCLITASDGTIWGGTQASTGDGIMFRFTPFVGFWSPVPGDTWLSDVVLGQDGNIYGSTQDDNDLARGGLLYRYEPANNDVQVLNSGNPVQASTMITALTVGNDDRIWGGMEPTGKVFHYNTSSGALGFANGSNPITLDGVSTLVTGADGTIWGGTLGGHVFRIDPSDGTSTVLNSGATVLNGGGIVFDLAVGADGTIWGGEQNMGSVFSIDPSDDSITDWGQAVPGQDMVFAIEVGSDGLVYGSTFDIGLSGHIFALNPANSSFTDLGNPTSVPGNPIIMDLVTDGDGLIWGGTMGPGRIFTLDETTHVIVDGPSVIGNYTAVNSLLVDGDKDLWGATGGNRFGGENAGLFHLRPRAQYTSVAHDLGFRSRVKYLNWTESSGLSNTSVSLRMRSAPTAGELPTASWGPYVASSGSDPSVPNGRWVQYEVTMMKHTLDLGASPVIDEVEIAYKHVPRLTAEKVVDKTVAKRGTEITYTLYFNNTGPVAAANVHINDSLDQTLTILSSSDDGNRTGSSWYYPLVSAGTAKNITVTARINATATAGSVINNSFTVDLTDTEGEAQAPLVSNTVSTTVEEIDFPDLSAVKTVALGTAYPGDELMFNITLNNTGLGTASNVTVTDVLDPRLTVVDVQGATGGTAPLWSMDDILPGQERTLTLTTTIDDSIAVDLSIDNEATVNLTSILGDPISGIATNTVTTMVLGGPAPKLDVRKVVNSTKVEPGEALRYTITINNTGNADATTVTVTDDLSPDLTYLGSSHESNRTGSTWDLPGLGPGATMTLEIRVTVKNNVLNGTVIPNLATVQYTNSTGAVKGNMMTNTVSTTVLTHYRPVMSLEKLVDRPLAAPGDELNYTIYFNNTGPAPAAWVAVDEVLPSQYVLFQSTSHPYLTPFRWNFTSVGQGTHALTITVLIKDNVPRDTYVTNTVLISYADSDGNYIGDLQSSVSTIVRGGEGADTTNPTVIATYPLRGDILVSVDTQIEVVFSEPMDKAKAQGAFRLDPNVTGNFSWNGNRMIFKPVEDLAHGTTYTVTIMTSAKDLAGNELARVYTWTFKTRSKDVVPDDAENLTCYVLSALVVGIGIGAIIFYIAYRNKFKDIETPGPDEDDVDVKEGRPKMDGGEPSEEESDIEELEEEAGSGPELALAEGEDEGSDEGPEEDEAEVIDAEKEEVVEEEPEDKDDAAGSAPEEDVEDEEHEEPPEEAKEEKAKGPSTLDDILKKLKD